MPSGEIHRKITKLILGKPYSKVHRILDLPHIFYGSKHRKLFHSIDGVLLGYLLDGEEGALAAAIHILTDKVWKK